MWRRVTCVLRLTMRRMLRLCVKYCCKYLIGSSQSTGHEWSIENMDIMKFIGDILDRHDLQIRQEIDNRIEELKQELEQL